jgi:hypothetical protein
VDALWNYKLLANSCLKAACSSIFARHFGGIVNKKNFSASGLMGEPQKMTPRCDFALNFSTFAVLFLKKLCTQL